MSGEEGFTVAVAVVESGGGRLAEGGGEEGADDGLHPTNKTNKTQKRQVKNLVIEFPPKMKTGRNSHSDSSRLFINHNQ